MDSYDWMAGLYGMICFAALAWFIIGILLCIWVYRDAERRGMNGALWLIVVLIAGIIGLIIYLIVRKDKAPPYSMPPPPMSPPPMSPPPPPPPQPSAARFCAKCGRAVPPNVRYCENCGTPVPE